MKNILTIHNQDIFPGSPALEHATFRKRRAARAVVLDDSSHVALLKVGAHGYHKLPGGGMEEGESVEAALAREVLEETGCEVSITAELGEILELRNDERLRQTSYCFLAKQIGEKGEPHFTDKERRDKFSVIWVESIGEAIQTLERDEPTNTDGKFIRMRDLAFLKFAKQKLGNAKL